MSVHKLNTDRLAQDHSPLAVGLTFHHELYDLADTVLKTRAIRALESAAARYPIHRVVRCAARRKLEDVFDDLALQMGLTALRLEEGALLLDGPGVFVHAEGRRKADYSSCSFGVWVESKARLEEVREALFRVVGERYAPEQTFTIDWHFMNARAGLRSASFDELATEPIHDEAYPTLGRSVPEFVRAYLDASETVLILQGGVVRAQGRKIIFTTNLPNVSDIDAALLRPGRCFANVRTRALNREEAAALLGKLSSDLQVQRTALARAFAGTASASVADLYRACATL